MKTTECRTIAAMAALAVSVSFAGATGKAPKDWGSRINWQAWARTVTQPAMGSAFALTDGDTESAVKFCVGGEAGADLRIVFPRATEITGVRFCQRAPAATHYRLCADLAGKGDFAELLKDQTDDKAVVDQWIEIPVGRQVTGLRLTFVAGAVGYRGVYPKLAELEIYGSASGATVPRSGGRPVETLESVALPALDRRDIDVRVCTDWWNWQMGTWDKERAKCPDVRDWRGYRSTLRQLRELGVTSVRLFAESEACAKNGGFSSFPLEGLPPEQQHDYLRPLAEALHKDGYPIYYFSHAWRAPIQRIGKQPAMPWLRWDYPYMASDALVGINEHYTEWYPCVLSDDDFRMKWTDLLRGALTAGADGVYLCPDEYYYKGHNLSRCTCRSCAAAFKRMYGYDALPVLKAPKTAQNAQGQVSAPLPVDDEHYRKYKLFEYRQLANLFDRVGADLRREFPEARLVMNENQGAVLAANGRLEHTLANDLFGASRNFDEKQVYGGGTMGGDRHVSHIAFTRHFAAACGADRLLSSAGWGPGNMFAPTEQYNGVIPEVFLGAKSLEIYRLNYIYEFSGSSVWKKTLKMIRLLQAWGLKESRLPASDVGFVYSRASEDWWFVKVAAKMNPDFNSGATDFNLNLADETINKIVAGKDNDEKMRQLAQERLRGWGAQQTVESVLAANAVNYDVVLAERDDNLKDLSRFKTLVIPFGYALSDAAVAAIKAAHAAGTKLVIFEKLGETDEYGTPRKEPALKDLIGQKGVTFFDESATDNSANLRRLWDYRQAVLAARGETGYWFDANGMPVASLVRELKDGSGWLLYLCNTANRTKMWAATRTARVSLGLPAKEGATYRMETFSSDSCDLNVNAIDGATALSAKDLNRFCVSLDPQEVKIVRICRLAEAFSGDEAALRTRYEKELYEHVVPFWERHSIDREAGGYLTCLDRDGKVYDTTKDLWLEWREVYMFAALNNRGRANPEWVALAKHGYDFLTAKGREADGSYATVMNRDGSEKTTAAPLVAIFTHGFAAMACAELYRATGETKYRDEALSCWKHYRRIWSENESEWRQLSHRVIGLNVMNVFNACFQGAFTDEAKAIAAELPTFVEPKTGLLCERVRPNGSHDFSSQYGRFVNSGHAVEAMSFLFDHIAQTGDRSLLDFCAKTALKMFDFGWDAERGGGFVYRDALGLPCEKTDWMLKTWWANCEAATAMLRGWRLTGDRRFLERFVLVDAYDWENFSDPEGREWFAYAPVEGRRCHTYKGNVRKGFFHLPRRLLDCIELLKSDR